ncbi:MULTISPECIES: exonuclease SbcCD subunit D [Brevibacillus]|jgi:exonuclease SbcD|uniref:exonuclease SbcCD subunit D n=1 Tax=Brevibacillus TaxID=55080 RepID=UPI00046A7BDB|nr:exonuclease SbcCD subunit D [Brevibacillus borstelensis]KKX57065.1 nuclease SbcCD subunit D [Brevibacillus borstelensis cifa_chp40]MBE5395782.1 exonuclease SbcCD subunit D [Brevibacillus borstelensis]MCM3590315.1 exonuclease SbcCD subunit D [Brevibacillus borstelensis]MED1874428.1 exonuclease SbcCD subunit D [Brevibacillus borstelensis]MED1885684.1 exonuclease SbcCD subunit D [Brevibacillus borstelensis]
MRILHTADWHFGRQLEGRDRRGEQSDFVDELCRIAEEKDVQLVLIAGDVYDSVNPPAWAEELFYTALERLSAGGRRAVVVIAGNHDQPERVRAAAPIASKQGIVLLGLPKETPILSGSDAPRDKVRVLDGGPSWMELAVPGVEHHAVILALPYPSEARLKELLSDTFTQEQMQLAFSERIKTLLDELSVHFREDTVNLVTSHLFVMGGRESDSERPIQIGGALTVSPSAFPEKADYVALGHLHRLQKLGEKPLIRYSGSPLGYSFSEAGQSKAVVIVDVVPGEEVQEEIVYLTSGRPLARWKATEGIAQVEKWLEEGRDAGAWIDLELHVSDVIDPAEFQRLRKMSDDFLKVQRVVVREETADSASEQRAELSELLPDQLFRRFYERKRGAEPDEKLVALFQRLLNQIGEEEGTR